MIARITDDSGFHAREFMGVDFYFSAYVNEGDWFGETWLVVFAGGLAVVVEGEHEQAVIDNLADSEEWSHLIDVDDCPICDSHDPTCDCDGAEYAGNDSHRVNTTDIAILARCEVK